MRRLFPAAAIGAVAFCLMLAGCGELDPPYSSLVKYVLRSDPLVLSEKLGDERYDPDRPGQLPLFSMKELFDPIHPLYAKKDTAVREGLMRDPAVVPAADRHNLEFLLEYVFGTPANPTVELIDDKTRDALKLDSRTLERGSVLYRIHCLHCHGVSGDGRGPTARWVNPHPRDYRQGLFKFQSVDQTDETGRPPRRDDLHRVIKYGIESTAMPAFVLLPDSEVELLVSYVIHLSIRGKVEYDVLSRFDLDEGKFNEKLENLVELSTKAVASKWMQSPTREIKIAPFPFDPNDKAKMKESVRRGQVLFLGVANEEAKAANCVNCHTDYGRQSKFRFDKWGTLVRPNNLTHGIYRGGRRTIDLYYRIHSGINGSEMASFGKQLKSESIWDLINFVQTLPYPAMRRELGVMID